MQSFTTQSHARNYQGNVVLPATRSPKKRRKALISFTTSALALAVAIMGGLWGATAVHNYQLKQQVETVSTSTTQTVTATDNTEQENKPMTLESYAEESKTNNQETSRTYPLHKKRPLRPLMVAEQTQEDVYHAEIVHAY